MAATIPMLIAYDAAVGPTPTTRIVGAGSLRREPRIAPEYVYDEALDGYDGSLSPRVTVSAGAVRAYGVGRVEHAHGHEAHGEGAINDAPATTTAAEGLGAAGAAAKFTASTPQSAIALAKQLASEAQLGEMAAGAGRPIADPGTATVFRDAARIAQTYGGNAADWAKMSSSGFRAADGTTFATHWVENVVTGAQAEPKVVIDIFGGP